MSETLRIRLATAADVRPIAAMSRDLIETGLGWSWTPARVARAVRGEDSVAAVAAFGPQTAGFAIMRFGREEANLDLLAVGPGHRRRGVGRELVRWLEESALVAGVSIVRLQVRADRPDAQAFYRSLGYRQWHRVAGYYGHRRTAVYMAHDLWCPPIADGVNPS